MKYYSEEVARVLRRGFEEKVVRWPKVSARKTLGCPSCQADGKLFAFLVTDGIVITQLAQADGESMSRQHRVTPFRAGRKVVQNWMRLPIKNGWDLERIMRFVRKSYESALRGG